MTRIVDAAACTGQQHACHRQEHGPKKESSTHWSSSIFCESRSARPRIRQIPPGRPGFSPQEPLHANAAARTEILRPRGRSGIDLDKTVLTPWLLESSARRSRNIRNNRYSCRSRCNPQKLPGRRLPPKELRTCPKSTDHVSNGRKPPASTTVFRSAPRGRADMN